MIKDRWTSEYECWNIFSSDRNPSAVQFDVYSAFHDVHYCKYTHILYHTVGKQNAYILITVSRWPFLTDLF